MFQDKISSLLNKVGTESSAIHTWHVIMLGDNAGSDQVSQTQERLENIKNQLHSLL